MIRPAALLLAAALLAPGGAAGQGADRKAALDQMLAALQVAPSEEAAAALEATIRTQWIEQASPAVRLLLVRGVREVNEGSVADALDSFDAALDLEPNLVEAWRGRAQARYRLGDTPGAVRDIQETLRREPRHFVALQDLSRMSEVTTFADRTRSVRRNLAEEADYRTYAHVVVDEAQDVAPLQWRMLARRARGAPPPQ